MQIQLIKTTLRRAKAGLLLASLLTVPGSLMAQTQVIGWGSAFFGETTPPPGLNDAVAIAAGTGVS